MGSAKCPMSPSSQPAGTVQSESTNATNGERTRARPAFRAPAGPRLRSSRTYSAPASRATFSTAPARTEQSSTTMTGTMSSDRSRRCSISGRSRTGTTTLTRTPGTTGSGRGWRTPARTRRLATVRSDLRSSSGVPPSHLDTISAALGRRRTTAGGSRRRAPGPRPARTCQRRQRVGRPPGAVRSAGRAARPLRALRTTGAPRHLARGRSVRCRDGVVAACRYRFAVAVGAVSPGGPSGFRVVILDFFGTVVCRPDGIAPSYAAVFERHGYRYDDEVAIEHHTKYDGVDHTEHSVNEASYERWVRSRHGELAHRVRGRATRGRPGGGGHADRRRVGGDRLSRRRSDAAANSAAGDCASGSARTGGGSWTGSSSTRGWRRSSTRPSPPPGSVPASPTLGSTRRSPRCSRCHRVRHCSSGTRSDPTWKARLPRGCAPCISGGPTNGSATRHPDPMGSPTCPR